METWQLSYQAAEAPEVAYAVVQLLLSAPAGPQSSHQQHLQLAVHAVLVPEQRRPCGRGMEQAQWLLRAVLVALLPIHWQPSAAAAAASRPRQRLYAVCWRCSQQSCGHTCGSAGRLGRFLLCGRSGGRCCRGCQGTAARYACGLEQTGSSIFSGWLTLGVSVSHAGWSCLPEEHTHHCHNPNAVRQYNSVSRSAVQYRYWGPGTPSCDTIQMLKARHLACKQTHPQSMQVGQRGTGHLPSGRAWWYLPHSTHAAAHLASQAGTHSQKGRGRGREMLLVHTLRTHSWCRL